MPILPSEVDGVEPGPGGGDETRRRLRELCEVLLTSRAKMLGLSKSFSHRFSELPNSLKSALVSSIGEIVAHLDSFEIKLGDTRLTGKVKLGADGGMEEHFPGSGGFVPVNVKGTFRSDATFGERGPGQHIAHGRMEGRTVVNDEPSPARFRSGEHPQLGGGGGEPRPRRRRERVRESEEPALPSPPALPPRELPEGATSEESTEAYGHVWRNVQERQGRGLDRHRMDRRQAEELAWICLGGLWDANAPRPAAHFVERDEARVWLERHGYVHLDMGKCRPTMAGLVASGLFGTAHLHWQP